MRVLIAGGGTGGHLFPGIALAEELISRGQNNEVLFIGTQRGIEARVLPALGYPHEFIQVQGIKGTHWSSRLRRMLLLPAAVLDSMRIIRRFAPDVAVGVGGYASGPPILAARLLGVPCAILEQNSVPGATNRLLGRLAQTVFTTFESSQVHFPAAKVQLLGNPIRRQLLDNFLDSSIEDRKHFRLLVLGGSQGARGINEAMAEAAPLLATARSDLRVVHQAGEADVPKLEQAYGAAGVSAQVTPFIEDMSAAYRAADLVVCRAGATTLAEVTVAKKPSILIPFPHATDNHQELNAQVLVDAGAALLLRQEDASPERLATEILSLADDPERRASMERAAAGWGRPEAAREIIDACTLMVRDGR